MLEAQALIVERGIDGFTIRDLSRRASVAPRTLYNSLGTREEIIARATTEFYQSLLEAAPSFKVESLPQLVARAEYLCLFVLQHRAYATAMVATFFSATVDSKVFSALQDICIAGYGDLLADAQEAGILRPLSDAEARIFVDHFAKMTYGLVNDWVSGRLDDSAYRYQVPIKFLATVHAFLRPEVKAEADTLQHYLIMRVPPD